MKSVAARSAKKRGVKKHHQTAYKEEVTIQYSDSWETLLLPKLLPIAGNTSNLAETIWCNIKKVCAVTPSTYSLSESSTITAKHSFNRHSFKTLCRRAFTSKVKFHLFKDIAPLGQSKEMGIGQYLKRWIQGMFYWDENALAKLLSQHHQRKLGMELWASPGFKQPPTRGQVAQ